MKIAPMDVGRVVAALQLQLKENFEVAKMRVTVERSARNEDPNATPWVSIYRFGQRLPPRALGMGAGFRSHEIDLAIACQASSIVDGENCEANLEALLSAVIGAILSDPTFKGTVNSLGDEFDVQYPDYQLADGVYMQTAVIQFTALTTVNVIGG